MDRVDLINDFKEKYKKLIRWDSYMQKRAVKGDLSPDKWNQTVNDFLKKIVDPCEESWAKLTIQAKAIFN